MESFFSKLNLNLHGILGAMISSKIFAIGIFFKELGSDYDVLVYYLFFKGGTISDALHFFLIFVLRKRSKVEATVF